MNYLADDGSTLIQGIEEIGNMTGRYRILQIALATGDQRVASEDPLGPDVNVSLVRELSSDRYVALRSTMSLWESLETGTPLRLLDLETGELVPGVFPLDRPE